MSAAKRSRKEAREREPWVPLLPRTEADLLAAEPVRRDAQIAIGIVLLYVIANITYGVLSLAPWDDDCVTRYFNTLRATSEPKYFFDLWSRPLFVILFAGTAKLGLTAMMVQMVLINAAAGWVLFKAVQRIGMRNAWMVLVFYFFQTYFFSTSRNNLTEPLAAAVICFGLHALVHRRYLLFAVLGSLLPLARLELSVALAIWALVLVLEHQWKYVFVLMGSVVLLAVGGWLVMDTDSPLWLVDKTLNKDTANNRYGHQEFLHYFKRFCYVVGPVVFYFLIIGLGERLARLRMDLFVLLQGLLIFLIYVIFSWKLNMGNAAGFLRNLIPLAPFVAILALQGLNYWLSVAMPERPAEVATEPETTAQPKARKGQRHGTPAPAPKTATRSGTPRWRAARIHALSLLTVLIVHLYFSTVLLSHHKISTTPERVNVIVVAVLALMLIVLALLSRKRALASPVLAAAIFVCIGAGTFAHTLITEPPGAHLNPERRTLSALADRYKGSYLEAEPLYINHTWFFWHARLKYPDPRFHTLTMQHVKDAPPHALFVWENHYSHRLAGDVQENWIAARKDLVELCRMVSTDHRFRALLYQKVDSVAQDGEKLRDAFITAFPDEMGGYYSRALNRSGQGRHNEVLDDANTMLRLDSTSADARYMHALARFNLNDNAGAISEFEALLKRDSLMTQSRYFIGAAYLRMNEPKKAIAPLRRLLKDQKDMAEGHEQLAVAYYREKDFVNAWKSFGEVIRLRPKNYTGYLNRSLCSTEMGKHADAIADLDRALALRPNDPQLHFNKASAYFQLNDRAKGCASLQQAAALGLPQAQSSLGQMCR